MLTFFKKTLLFREIKPVHWLLIFAGFIVLHVPAIMNDHHDTNAYVMLSTSLLKGKLSLPDSGFSYFTQIQYSDMIFFNGKHYLPYPPLPAVLLMPYVLLAGTHGVNSVLVCVLLSCLNILLLYRILKRLLIKQEYIPWLIYAFFFGTGYWYVLFTSHHVYAFAEIVAVTFLLLGLCELFGRRRMALIGLFLGCAFLSRQLTLFIGLFMLIYCHFAYRQQFPDQQPAKAIIKGLFPFLYTLVPCILLYLAYNYYRFGNPLDSGYAHIKFIGILKERVQQYGVFSIHYIPINFYQLFLKGFNISFTGPGLMQIQDMDLFGASLLSASPFIISALKTKQPLYFRWGAWVSIAVIVFGILAYHNNGFEQVNCYRFTLDFLPLLFILIAYGAANIPGWIMKGMIIYAVALNILAMAIHLFFHTLTK